MREPDANIIAAVLREVIVEVGSRYLLPHDLIGDWLKRLGAGSEGLKQNEDEKGTPTRRVFLAEGLHLGTCDLGPYTFPVDPPFVVPESGWYVLRLAGEGESAYVTVERLKSPAAEADDGETQEAQEPQGG